MEILTKTTSLFTSDVDPLKFDYRALASLDRFRRPTIFLGLGGGGSAAVSLVKELFCRTFAGKTEPGAGGLPAGFQFLAFDSATSDRPHNLDFETEWIQLDGRGISGTEWDRLKQDPRFRDWAPQHFSGVDFPQGCSGYRTLGRFLFNVNIGKFRAAFRNHYDAAMQKVEDNPAPVVYVFCTLAGGTGSGCLLDVCFHLRGTYPGLSIMGFLALAEGFGSDHALHQRAKVGVFAALKEVDHFMSPGRLDDWIAERRKDDPDSMDQSGVFHFPMDKGVIGKYTKPFDCCFPFGAYNNRNVLTLEKSQSMSAFMARIAFSLAAYPPAPAGGQAFDSARSNFGDRLMGTVGGANTSYMVPALGGLHAPVEHTMDLMAFQSAINLLDYLDRGSANPAHRDEAERFLSDQSFTNSDLARLADLLIESGGTLPEAESAAQFERLDAILKNPGQRHDPSNGTKLRAPFEEALEQGLKEAIFDGVFNRAPSEEEKRAAERDPENKAAQARLASFPMRLAGFTAAFQKATAQLACDPAYRRLGIEDFVKDTLSLLEEARRRANTQLRAVQELLDDKVRMSWKRGAEFRELLENLITDSGFFDFERHLEEGLRSDYAMHLRETYGHVREWITQKCVVSALDQACDFVEREAERHSTLYSNYRSARSLLADKASDLERQLFNQASGLVDEVDVILSRNIMDRAWRERFAARHGIEATDACCANLVQRSIAKGRQGGDGVHPWLKAEWSPLHAITLHEDRTLNPVGRPLAAIIAQDMANATIRAIWDDFQPFSIWANGEGILRAFEYADDSGAKGAAKALVERMLLTCQPQYDLSETTRLDQSLQSYTAFAGPSGVADSLLQSTLGGSTINRANTYETHRITMVSFTYPVGLPICPRIRIQLQSAYDAHFNRTPVADEARRFHAYPDARSWRNPYEIDEPRHPADAALCRAILVSQVLEDGASITHPNTQLALQSAMKELDRLTDTPRTKLLGAFAVGGTEYWLTPFCSVDVRAGTAAGLEPPIQLGVGLPAAFDSVRRNATMERQCRLWSEWFASNKSTIFTDTELKSHRDRLVSDLRLNASRASRESEAKAWGKLLAEAASDFLFTD